jgi:glycosyltransferase involved in cell wall biosynthesis
MTDADAPVQGFATDWINALARHSTYIDVLTMEAGRIALPENVQVYSVGKERGYSEPRRAIEFYRLLRHILKTRRHDVCFAHMQPLFAIMGAPLLKAANIPTTLWYAHKSVTPKLRLAEKVVHRVVTASPESFRIDSPKARIVGHGIDTNIFIPAVPPEQFTILSVSRIAPVKRIETLISAAHLLDELQLDFRLRIVGNVYPQDEHYARHLRKLVGDYHLGHRVDFVGAVPHHEIAREYQQSSVMVNVSSTGSVDKAVLEAMACGLPVVTANEAFQAMLAPWQNQLLIPMDAPDVLAAKVRELASMDVTQRQALGVELREIVIRDHSLDRLAEVLAHVFRTGEVPA